MYYSVAFLLVLGSDGLNLNQKSKVNQFVGLQKSSGGVASKVKSIPGVAMLSNFVPGAMVTDVTRESITLYGEITSTSTAGGVTYYSSNKEKGVDDDDPFGRVTTNIESVEKQQFSLALKQMKSCSSPTWSGKPFCKCPVQDYFACKDSGDKCKDVFGFCDPARDLQGSAFEMITSTPEGFGLTPTCDLQQGVNGIQECKQSFVADFRWKGLTCVCFESAPNAPMRLGSQSDPLKGFLPVTYEVNMLGRHRMEFPYLYKHAAIEKKSCQDRGIVFDKKVNPCNRHAYSVFRNTPCQNAFRAHRKKEMIAHEFAVQKAIIDVYQQVLNPGHPLSITQGMYAGQCNTGQ